MIPKTKSKPVAEPMVTIRLRIVDLNPDRTPYKQYNTRFQAEDLYVVVSVPKVYVLNLPGPETVLTLDGMAYINNEIASANERMHQQWMEGQK